MTEASKISTLLVANRGEIALRIMRTAKEEGIRTIAVYSEADVDAPHVKFADEAVCIGPAPVGESYLVGGNVIQAALDKGADAIHPGYGFLSENPGFAKAVAAAELVFVGPPVQAIEIMGDKARAKRRMSEAGVPCVPGYEGDDQDRGVFEKAAEAIGYPVMVKAAAGGGGRGMRLVATAEDLSDALRLARSEAENAFGSGQLILEKAIVRPRHVEIQVFADDHGGVIHLGERDCSVQRRHQKVVEEAPCPVMTPELRDAMGSAAVEAARAVGYRGAGTVEFLLDESGRFYFLEMNTRLQVEHPVTELVTGLDLVALQLAVAEGRPLGIDQADVRLDGHAMEVRLYAEDPTRDFLPSTGPVHYWSEPYGIRTDAGVVSGGEISPFYDSMVAKIIAWGANRDEARRKLVQGMSHTALLGTETNRDFLIDVLEQPVFAEGGATTAFIDEIYGAEGWRPPPLRPEELAAVGLIEHVLGQRAALLEAPLSEELMDWSSARDLATVLRYELEEGGRRVSVHPQGKGAYQVSVDEVEMPAVADKVDDNHALLTIDGHACDLKFWKHPTGRLFVALPRRSFSVLESAAAESVEAPIGGDGLVNAPMHGQLLEILVVEGDVVTQGDKLAVLEAMKMQHEILAEVSGTVVRVVAAAGAQIAADERILEIEPTVEAAPERRA
jgi:geranyl-CoA carboxylase alpha subunit